MRRFRGAWLDEAGSSLTLLVVSVPLIMGVLGLVVDTGLYALTLNQLTSAADAAALAGVTAIDLEAWRATGEIRFVPDRVRQRAEAFAQANFTGPLVVEIAYPADHPNRIDVRVRSRLRPVFMQIFGIPEVPVQASGQAQVG